MSDTTQIAETILAQLGGREFRMMTGAKHLVADGPALLMSLPRNATGGTRLRISLNDNDLYDLEFMRIRKFEATPVASETNVHVEDLRATFTRMTGYDTRLPRIVGVNA